MRLVAMTLCALAILAGERASADSSLFAPYTKVPYPDLVTVLADVVYDKSMSDALTVRGYSEKINFSATPGDFDTITDGSSPSYGDFILDTVIHTGADLTGQSVTGTLEIKGKTASYTSGTLLTGDLFAFRTDGTDQMEFLYTITGGDVAGLYGGLGKAGMIVLGATGFPLDTEFSVSFNNLISDEAGTGPGLAGTFRADFSVVPEPGSFLLAVVGVVGLAGGARLRRKRQNKQNL